MRKILPAHTITLAGLMAALTALGGWCAVPVPFTPVPITLQTFFVLFSGFALGPLAGPLSQLIYILLGITGIPVFSGFSAGPGVLAGPTGGFIAGFLLSSWICGLCLRCRPSAGFWSLMLFSLAGLGALYLSGILWLSLFFPPLLKQMLIMAVLPFLPGDLLKALLASLLVIRIRSLLNRPLPMG